MDPTTRRSFVRKSLATTVSISFAGLIRAHGEEAGGSTNTTAWETTIEITNETTSDPFESTVPQTEQTVPPTTAQPKDSKKRRWKCKLTILGPRSTPYTQQELDDADRTWGADHPGYWGTPTGPPQGSHKISGPVDIAFWNPTRPEGCGFARWRENGPTMSNWEDTSVSPTQYYAAYLYDYLEEESEDEPSDEP